MENNRSCKVAAQAASGGFKVSGSVLKDANGNTFIARGVNNPHAWYDSQAYNVLRPSGSRG